MSTMNKCMEARATFVSSFIGGRRSHKMSMHRPTPVHVPDITDLPCSIVVCNEEKEVHAHVMYMMSQPRVIANHTLPRKQAVFLEPSSDLVCH